MNKLQCKQVLMNSLLHLFDFLFVRDVDRFGDHFRFLARALKSLRHLSKLNQNVFDFSLTLPFNFHH